MKSDIRKIMRNIDIYINKLSLFLKEKFNIYIHICTCIKIHNSITNEGSGGEQAYFSAAPFASYVRSKRCKLKLNGN